MSQKELCTEKCSKPSEVRFLVLRASVWVCVGPKGAAQLVVCNGRALPAVWL